jgi:hypothetical protein
MRGAQAQREYLGGNPGARRLRCPLAGDARNVAQLAARCGAAVCDDEMRTVVASLITVRLARIVP